MRWENQTANGMRQSDAAPPRQKMPHGHEPTAIWLAAGSPAARKRSSFAGGVKSASAARASVPASPTYRGTAGEAPSGHLLPGSGTPGIPIPHPPSLESLRQVFGRLPVVGFGRGLFQSSDHTGPADSDVCPEAIEGLFLPLLIAVGSLSGKPLTTVGASERQTETGKRSPMEIRGAYAIWWSHSFQMTLLAHAGWRPDARK